MGKTLSRHEHNDNNKMVFYFFYFGGYFRKISQNEINKTQKEICLSSFVNGIISRTIRKS